MINDQLKVLDVSMSDGLNSDTRNNVVRTLLDKRDVIESVFHDDEYLKMDLTHGEIIGLKSTAKIGTMDVGDLPAMDFVIRNNEKYKNATIINLGNVSVLYNEIKEDTN